MSPISAWLINQDIPQQTLVLLLFIPVLVTVINITKYIFGLKTFGVYAPLILAMSFYFTGIRYGLVITTIVILCSLLNYSLLKKVRMHYVARIVINYILISVLLILVTAGIKQIPYGQEILQVKYIDPLAIASIAAISDFFIKQYVRKSFSATLRSLSETIISSIISIAVIRSEMAKDFVLNYPWTIILLIPINLLIGKFTGLKLSEYLRFRELISNAPRSPQA